MAEEKRYAAKCPHCETRLKVRSTDLGAKRTCPKCKQVFALPNPKSSQLSEGKPAATSSPSEAAQTPDDDWQPPVEVPIVCRVCTTRYYASESQVGQRLPCPDCGVDNQVFPPPKEIKNNRQQPLADITLSHIGDGVREPRALPGNHPDQFRVICRVCETVHYCLPKQSGEKIRCVDCGTIFTVPAAPVRKAAPKLKVNDPGIGLRPAAKTQVFKSNADSLLEKANEKYHEREQQKPIPPDNPFVDKVWSLPFQLEILPILLAVSILASFIPYLVTIALESSGLASLFGMAMMSAAGLLAILTYMIMTNSVKAITVSASMGLTKIDFPRFEMFAYVMTGVLLFTSISVGFGPGVTLALLTKIPWVGIIALPFGFFVFPFVYLSMLDAGSPAVPYTPYMASTLKEDRSTWIRFYLTSLPAFLLVFIPQIAAIWLQIRATKDTSIAPITPMIASIAAIFCSVFGILVYFCLVGRLAWVIDQDTQKENDEMEAASEAVTV